jgi:hypothetical protein
MTTLYLKSSSWSENIGDFFDPSNSLQEMLDAAQDLQYLNEIDSPKEIVFCGHSSEALINSSTRIISSQNAQSLAKAIKDKYKKNPGNKKSLEHFYLISCEAGLKVGGTPSFAETFTEEMFKLGFTNLQVHAMTPPLIADAGSIVQTEGKVGEALEISAWGYKTTKDMEQDQLLQQNQDESLKALTKEETELKKLGKPPGLLTSPREYNFWKQKKGILDKKILALNKAIEGVKEKQEALRVYTCQSQHFKEAMNKPWNTFRSKQKASDLYLDENSCLERLGANSWWSQFIAFLTETKVFTSQLAKHLKMFQHDKVHLNNNQKELETAIKQYQNLSTRSNLIKNTRLVLGDSSKSQTLAAEFRVALATNEPKQEDLTKIQKAYNNFKRDKSQDTSLDHIYNTLSEHLNNKINLISQERIIRAGLSNAIATYISQHVSDNKLENLTDKNGMHLLRLKANPFDKNTPQKNQGKVYVMMAIHAFLQDPSKQLYNKIIEAQNRYPQWNKGFLSQVRTTMAKVERFHEEMDSQQETTPTPINFRHQ